MKQSVLARIFIAFFFLIFSFSCENSRPENATQPHEFEPVTSPDTAISAQTPVDSHVVADTGNQPEIPETKTERQPMPTAEELKEVTPDQAAKRALHNDAMKAARMKPDAFVTYMKTRIPYYRGKGNLKAENDLVRIRINKTEMKIETMQGAQTFPMQ
ncbi:hypothetical protein I5M27_17770 [Adhaeribacter sp. BT258]|uniref:Lipoprotein n=1 Tax=Adhaeribacter terrigena TaxID=2793070 RepID=A0ABS1C645_9BACT|nr:hypothetical protein [Adhaeribacter terrigena]MBK0404844.1 hypothetical protein [Adhaeribacter terrigena]